MDKIIAKMLYNRKEHKKFYMFHLFRRSLTLYFMLGLLILLGALTVVNVVKGESVTFSIIMFGITMGIVPYLIISRVNEVVKQETPERIKSTDTVEVTKHKITRSNDVITGKATIGWNELDCVCENNDYIFMYTADNSGLFIKKDCIVEGDLILFRKLALANLPNDKKGKKRYFRYGKIRKEYNKARREEKKLARSKK